MKLHIYTVFDRRIAKHIIQKLSPFILFILIISCESLPKHPLSSDEVFRYSAGDTLVFKSNFGNLNKLIIDKIRIGFADNTYTSYASYQYEYQEVYQHFLNDAIYLRTYDSLFALSRECYLGIHPDWCDSLENFEPYDMKVDFYTAAEGNYHTEIRWKGRYFLCRDELRVSDIELNGKIYRNVYRYIREETDVDSLRTFEALYFSLNLGILKYENRDGEIFEFLEVR